MKGFIPFLLWAALLILWINVNAQKPLGRYFGTGVKFAPGEVALTEKTGNYDGGIGGELSFVFRYKDDFEDVNSTDFLVPLTVNGHIPLRSWMLGMSINAGVGVLAGLKFLPDRVATQTGYYFNIGLDYTVESAPFNFSLEWSPRWRSVYLKEPVEITEKFNDIVQIQIGVRYTGLFQRGLRTRIP